MKLPGRYKGNRRRREPPIVASCVCGWRSRPCSSAEAERQYQAHIAVRHAWQSALLLPAPAKIVDGARFVTRCVGAAN